ncbi:uncharacterized protein LOC121290359 isoform X1 [Carcharodon carcharias]|uniref:uncharacterized protein LOC121290359 isoform X1 n=1 Tax=Carcharodon carcharias TaxID=13397 RepID=UPI001B7E8B4C|nr:uncharacterized protein LOC121290359 isoform X1 [Carcharodon carcharias]
MSSLTNCFTKWILLIVTLVLTYGEDQVFQTPAVLKAWKGESAKISYFYLYNRTEVEMMSVSWWRSMWKKPVCRIRYINQTLERSPKCDRRVDITLELNAMVTHFTIQNLQLNDTDFYYCKIEFPIPPPTKEIQGNKTHLTVEAPPVVEVKFLDRPENGCCVQLVCRAENFLPGDIQLRWSKEGKEGSVWINSSITTASNNSNSGTSYVDLSHWENGDVYACHVNHSMLQIIRKLTISINERHEGRVYIWVVLASLCIILVSAIVYLLLKCSRKANPEVNQLYVNVGTVSRKEETASTCQNSNQNLNQLTNSNYSFIRHAPLIIYQNAFSAE